MRHFSIAHRWLERRSAQQKKAIGTWEAEGGIRTDGRVRR